MIHEYFKSIHESLGNTEGTKLGLFDKTNHFLTNGKVFWDVSKHCNLRALCSVCKWWQQQDHPLQWSWVALKYVCQSPIWWVDCTLIHYSPNVHRRMGLHSEGFPCNATILLWHNLAQCSWWCHYSQLGSLSKCAKWCLNPKNWQIYTRSPLSK